MLPQLRDRLLRESQVMHAPSEALRSVERGEKRTVHLGPPTPSWLNNRPYLSLDFVKLEHRQDPGALGKLNSVPLFHAQVCLSVYPCFGLLQNLVPFIPY